MAKAKTNKLYRTFVNGVITEAGYLTYPEDASTDELNTLLSRKGNRSRRLGVDYEDDYELVDVDASESFVTQEHVWNSVNNNPDVSFTCVQVGSRIHFFEMNENSLSSSKKTFTINLNTYKIPSALSSSIPTEYASFSSGSGYLFIAHRYIDPISIEYKPTTDQLVVVPIVIQIRDLEGVYDGLANDEEPRSLSAQHNYNLRNQGWVDPGTKTVDISTPSYVEGSSVYYDPYTGDTRQYDTNLPYWKDPDWIE